MIKKPDVFRIDEKNKNSAWGWKYYKDYKDGTKPVRKLITQRKDGTPYKTKKEAEEAREAFIRTEHIRHGLGCNTEATLSDVYKTYSNTETWRSLALGTQRRYDSSWRVHISPELGDFKIASITAFQLREYLLQKYNNGVTFSNLENIYKVLSILFRYAANVGIIQLKVYKDMFKETTGLRIMPEKMRGEIKKPPITFSDIELYNMEKYLRDTKENPNTPVDAFEVIKRTKNISMDYDLKRCPDYTTLKPDNIVIGVNTFEVAHFDTRPFENIEEFRKYRRKRKNVAVLRTVNDWLLFKAKIASDEVNTKIKDLEWSKLTSCIRYYRVGIIDIPTLSFHKDDWSVQDICDWIQSHNHSSKLFKQCNWKDCRKPDRLSSALPISEIKDLMNELQSDIP